MAIIRHEDALSRLPQNLLNIFVQREQMNLAKEDQKLREKDFKLKQEEAARAQALQEAEMRGAMGAAELFARQGQFTGLADAVAQAGPQAAPTLVNNIVALMGQAGQARQLQADADVAEGTVQPRVDQAIADAALAGIDTDFARRTLEGRVRLSEIGVEAADLDLDQTRAQIAQTRAQTLMTLEAREGQKLENILAGLKVQNDPARVERAWDMILSGHVTGAEAFAAYGITPTPALAELKLDPMPAGGEGGRGPTQKQQEAGTQFMRMNAANETINRLWDKGIRIDVAGSMYRSAKNPLMSAATGFFTNDEERQMIAAQQAFSDTYRNFISGQQSSDSEHQRLLMSVLENPGEGPRTVIQKRFIRQTIINQAALVRDGISSPVAAAQSVLDAAIQHGVDEDMIDVFTKQVEEARAYEAVGGYYGSPPPNAATGTDRPVDDLVDRAIGAPPRQPSRTPGG